MRLLLAIASLFLPVAAMAAPAPLDPAAVAAWADAQFGRPVAEGRANAATVTVVQGGRIVLARNYGRVSAPRERFLIASVTKTFTATAIAMLIADGRIASLDDPANRYLKRIKLPDAFGRPITIRQLLTHSAGFEERGFAVADPRQPKVPADAAFIQARLPGIVRAPGSRIVYANIDPPLLGVVVEDVTGMTMRDFLARRLFAPLGMTQTELVYDPRASDRLVQPLRGGQPMPFEINAPYFAPTGSVHTTGADMARFLNAQLGRAPAVLAPNTLSWLHTPLARNAPALDGIAMAFMVGKWRGEAVVGHAGVFSGFQSDMYLVPGRDIGVFYSWAGLPKDAPPLDFGGLQSSFLTMAIGPAVAPPPLAAQPDPSAYLGRYWQDRRPQTNFEAIVAADAVMTVTAAPGNRLMIDGKGPYYAFAPGAYTRAPEAGKAGPVYVLTGDAVLQRVGGATRVSGFGDPANQRNLALAALAVLLLAGLVALVRGRGIARIAGLVLVIGAVAVPAALLAPPGLEPDILGGRGWRFNLLAAVGWAMPLVAALLAWRLRAIGAVALIAALALLVPFSFFNLI